LTEQRASAVRNSNASQLLQKSYSLFPREKCDKNEKDNVDCIWYLVDLVRIASKMDPRQVDERQVEQWGQKLLTLAKDSSDPRLSPDARLAGEKNAATYISMIDPDGGMRILRQLAEMDPAKDSNGHFVEDVRAYAALRIFYNYWREDGSSSLREIEETADRIGQTGEYPYQAVSLIVAEIRDRDQQTATRLFNKALGAFLAPNPNYAAENRNDEFFLLLQNTRSAVNQAVFNRALRKFVDQVLESQPQKNFISKIQTTDAGSIQIKNSNEALLFHALPLIRECDPPLGKEVLDRNSLVFPSLTKSGARIDFEAVAYDSSDKPDPALQQGLLFRVLKMKDIDPEIALRMTSNLKGARHTIALASLMPSVSKTDTTRAKQLYYDEIQPFNRIEEPNSKRGLDAEVAMAEIAFYAQDFKGFEQYAKQALVDATNALSEAPDYETDKQGRTFYKNIDYRLGYSALTELVRFAAANDVQWVVDRILGLVDAKGTVFTARMLLYAAQGQAERDAH
jgi:hypothetical protein